MSDCSICLDNLNKGDLGALFCGHVFHFDCISPWVGDNHKCPLCNKCFRNLKKDRVMRLFTGGGGLSLSSLEEPTSSSSSDHQHQYWQERCNNLRKQLEETVQRLKTERQQTEQVEKERNFFLNKVNIYKSIKSVIDLENKLASSECQQKMRQWRSLPREELSLLNCALMERWNETMLTLDNKSKQLDRAYLRIDELKMKYKRAQFAHSNSNSKTATERRARVKEILAKSPSDYYKDKSSAKKLSKRPAAPILNLEDDSTDEDDQLITSVDGQNPSNSTSSPSSSSSATAAASTSANPFSTDRHNRQRQEQQRSTSHDNSSRRRRHEEVDSTPESNTRSKRRRSSTSLPHPHRRRQSNNGISDLSNSEDEQEDSSSEEELLSHSQLSEIIDSDDDMPPRPNIQFLSPVRHVPPNRWMLQRVIELSSDEEDTA